MSFLKSSKKLFIQVTLCFFLVCLNVPAYADFILNETVQDVALSSSDLSQIFTYLRRYWTDGSKIVVVLPLPRSIAFSMLAGELMVSSDQLRNMISFRVGTVGFTPIYALDENDMIIKVATTPNAIGFVAGKVFVGSKFGVRVVRIRQ